MILHNRTLSETGFSQGVENTPKKGPVAVTGVSPTVKRSAYAQFMEHEQSVQKIDANLRLGAMGRTKVEAIIRQSFREDKTKEFERGYRRGLIDGAAGSRPNGPGPAVVIPMRRGPQPPAVIARRAA